MAKRKREGAAAKTPVAAGVTDMLRRIVAMRGTDGDEVVVVVRVGR